MKKSISHLAHFLVEKVPVSFLKKPGSNLLVLLFFWIGMYSASAQDQNNWVKQTTIIGQWVSITYGNGLFVAVSSG